MRYSYYQRYTEPHRIWVWDSELLQGFWILMKDGKFSPNRKTWQISGFTPSYFTTYGVPQIRDPFFDEDLKVDEGL